MTPFLNQISAGAVLPAAWMAEMSARMTSAWATQAAQLMTAPAEAAEAAPAAEAVGTAAATVHDDAPAASRDDTADLRPVGGSLTAADEVVEAVASDGPDLEQDVSAMVDAIVDGPIEGDIAPDAGFDPQRLN